MFAGFARVIAQSHLGYFPVASDESGLLARRRQARKPPRPLEGRVKRRGRRALIGFGAVEARVPQHEQVHRFRRTRDRRLAPPELTQNAGGRRDRDREPLDGQTAIRKAERIERQLTEQRELLAAVSHEVRSPLARLRISSELLKDNPRDQRALASIENEVLEIDTLVGKLLASSRLDFGTLSRATLDAVALARTALERQGLPAETLEDESNGARFSCDPTLIARALVGEPSILLADEPTGNLDSKNGEAVMELLRDLHRAGSTICMVTHDNRFARHAERTIHLFDGRVVSEEEAAQAAAEAAAGKA